MNSKKTALTILLSLMTILSMGQGFPDVKVEDGKGKIVQTAGMIDGKAPVVVASWSSTCKYCIEEIDALSDALADIPDISCKVVCVPQLFVYDKKGRQVHSHTGYSAGDELETIKIIKDNQ